MRKKKKEEPLSPIDSLRAFLQGFIDAFSGNDSIRHWAAYYRLILERGTPFLTGKSPADYPEIKELCRHRRPKKKACYRNSQMLVSDYKWDNSLTQASPRKGGPRYYEGFASLAGMVPIAHAWLVMPDGNACDVTLDAKDAENAVYLGVPLPFKTMCKYILKYGESGPFANLYYLKDKQRVAM